MSLAIRGKIFRIIAQTRFEIESSKDLIATKLANQ
jgi:hypothetical protein